MKISKITRVLSLLVILLLSSCSVHKQVVAPDEVPTLILVSFDGCRYDYPDLTETPGLDEIAAAGVKADGLKTSFPSKTFPNHLSIVTGLYPGHHGIIANRIYDDVNDEFYTLGNGAATQGKWYQGEPIWVTAERQGVKTATFYWPGSEAEINGYRPTYFKAYDNDFPYNKRVEQVLNWLDMTGENKPRFISLYFDEPDHSGHEFGPATPEALSALEGVDQQLSDLLKGIKLRNLEDKVNIIVVSDHGMTELSRDSVVFFDDYINMDDVKMIDYSPIAAIRPKPGKLEEVYQHLKGAHPHMQVYKKGELPEEYHYNDYKFIQPIIAVADLNWTLTTHGYFDTHPDYPSKGTHGFDPNYKDMNAIFYAMGPSFKKGVHLPVIQNTNLYELMCHILKINPAPNDGSLEVTKSALRK